MKSLILVAVFASACGAGPSAASETLDDTVRAYNEGVRWQRFSMAASRVPAKERARFVEDMDRRAEEVRITDYEIVTIEPRGPREARVHVKLSWYRDNEQVLHQTHATQTWERQGKAWLIVDETKLRGVDMPGMVDRRASADESDREGDRKTPNPL